MVSVFDVGSDVFHQLFDGPAGVVSRDLGMQILPDSFDAVGLWTIRRKEVECDSIGQGIDGRLSPFAAVNRIVVRNQVDVGGGRIVVFDKSPELVDEQMAVFAIAFNEGQSTAASIQRTRQIVLPVPARSQHCFLNAGRHPLTSDLRIQMEINLIHVTG